MQHLTCIDVNKRSTKQKYSMYCNTGYRITAVSASPSHSVSTIESDKVLR